MRYGIIVFPGSSGDADMYHVLRDVLGAEVEYIWHRDSAVDHVDCLILPGGASYGDALRPGAIARFAPVMQAVRTFAERGGLVLGIGNGFQILCEAGLLPGAFLPNRGVRFISRSVYVAWNRPIRRSRGAANRGRCSGCRLRIASATILSTMPRWRSWRNEGRLFSATARHPGSLRKPPTPTGPGAHCRRLQRAAECTGDDGSS